MPDPTCDIAHSNLQAHSERIAKDCLSRAAGAQNSSQFTVYRKTGTAAGMAGNADRIRTENCRLQTHNCAEGAIGGGPQHAPAQ
jgi:hypothetical protein